MSTFGTTTEEFYACLLLQVESEFILESERESFIEQVREVIEMADEKGAGMKEAFPQVMLWFYKREQVGSTLVDISYASFYPNLREA